MAQKVNTTPKGVFMYPAIEKATFKYNSKTEKEYKVSLLIDEADAEAFNEELKEIVNEEFEKELRKLQDELSKASTTKAKNKIQKAIDNLEPKYPFTENTNDEDEYTGQYKYNFKNNETVTRKSDGQTFDMKPSIFDGMGRRITKTLNIGNGTVGKVGYQARPYYMEKDGVVGVSLKLSSVQIIKLEQFGASNPFGEEEGGYVFSEDDVIQDGGEETTTEGEHSEESAADLL